MYTECLIQWTDEEEPEYVIISDNEEINEVYDSAIFFYGLSRRDLEEAMKNQTVLEDGWVVKDIIGEFDQFDDELFKGEEI